MSSVFKVTIENNTTEKNYSHGRRGETLVDCFSECAKNVLKGRVSLSKRQFSRLEREKTNVCALASKRTSLRKKHWIVQKGGFIGALLMPAVATLGSLLVNRMLSDD